MRSKSLFHNIFMTRPRNFLITFFFLNLTKNFGSFCSSVKLWYTSFCSLNKNLSKHTLNLWIWFFLINFFKTSIFISNMVAQMAMFAPSLFNSTLSQALPRKPTVSFFFQYKQLWILIFQLKSFFFAWKSLFWINVFSEFLDYWINVLLFEMCIKNGSLKTIFSFISIKFCWWTNKKT